MALLIDVPGKGPCRLLPEFAALAEPSGSVERLPASIEPGAALDRLAAGGAVVLHGDWPRIDGIFRYCAREPDRLAGPAAVESAAKGRELTRELTRERRRRLHLLFVVARGDSLEDVSDPPFSVGLSEWLQEKPGEGPYLVPVRRVQRIATDIGRARDGIFMDFLGGSITIVPHVYVPSDLSVPRMFVEHGRDFAGRSVLDMGCGTGVIALLAARLGASRVVAVDSSDDAIRNTRLNAVRLGLEGKVESRDPGDLFAPVAGERFGVIVFNVPWIEGEARTRYDAANYDPGRKTVARFLAEAPAHLEPDGVVLVQCSDASDPGGLPRLKELAASSGLATFGDHSIVRRSRTTGMRERVHVLTFGAAG